MKHTPAPWKLGTETLIVRSSDRENHIADCGVSYSLSDEQMKANAILISAAPELLEALESVIKSWEYGETPNIAKTTYDYAKAALRKAKGETHKHTPQTEMKPEQQRIKIAEACGWIKANHLGLGWWRNPMQKTVCESHELPDYLNDLNAMHESVNSLSGGKFVSWCFNLEEICGSPVCYNATAAQRAEAFLKTLNLWEE